MEEEVHWIQKFIGGFSTMNSLKQTKELKNPGFIVFEGLDFSGKTYLAKRAVERLKWDFRFRLDVKYNHAFLRGGLIDGEHLISLSAENRVEYLLKGYRKDIYLGIFQ